MLKKYALILGGFALGGYAFGTSIGIAYEKDWLPSAVIKLIEKYYMLEKKVEELDRRLQKLEKGLTDQEKKPISEKVQAKLSVKVRSCPSLGCSTVVVLRKGEIVNVVGRKNKWMLIETEDGAQGWVPIKFLQDYSF